jgi:hypothetical protein
MPFLAFSKRQKRTYIFFQALQLPIEHLKRGMNCCMEGILNCPSANSGLAMPDFIALHPILQG